MSQPSSRRPLRTRDTQWAARVAQALVSARVRPNVISVASVGFAALAGGAFWWAGRAELAVRPWLFLAAAACIQLRLLCNLFDGMVAVEGGMRSKSGEIYNELPDRFADALIIAGAGYAGGPAWTPTIGWTAAVLAMITAYVRSLGVAAGASQYFLGPMAKPHRMALLTAACIVAALAIWFDRELDAVPWALAVMLAGCFLTIFRRARRIIQELEAK